MARTPLAQALVQLLRLHADAAARGLELSAAREERARTAERLSRREVLLGGAALATAATLSGQRALAASRGQPRIAIVGGGIAGLSAALTLADAGYVSTLYEALPNRVGGRMLSDRGAPPAPACGTCHTVRKPVSATWTDGQVTDVFGEMIDSGHTTMRRLARRYRLPLIDLLAAQPAGSSDTYHFFGSHYPATQADADFAPVYRALKQDLHAAGYPTTWESSKPKGRELDNLSVHDWIETRVPGGHQSPLGRLLDTAYCTEYGADTKDQSSLNLLYLLSEQPRPHHLSIYGASDEKFRIQGGVDRLPAAMAADLQGRGVLLNLGWVLESLTQRSDGTYQLTFDARGSQTVVADLVLLTCPFSALRTLDVSAAGFDALKLRAIREQGAGHNSKLQLQFATRLWNQPGVWGKGNGNSFSDRGYQATWECTRGQGGTSGILVNYTGGSTADAMSLQHPYGNLDTPGVREDAQRFLQQLEPVFPGITAQWIGRAASAKPYVNPYWRCSYSYWRVGQYQAFAGYERVRQGNVFFAGEHTSVDFQGFMEGGASEGVRAGKEILKQLRRHGNARRQAPDRENTRDSTSDAHRR